MLDITGTYVYDDIGFVCQGSVTIVYNII